MIDLSFDELENNITKKELEAEQSIDELIEQAKRENSRKLDTWDSAELFYKIYHNELFPEKFKDFWEFATWIGLDRSSIIAQMKAIEFDMLYHFDRSAYSVTKVYEISKTGNDYSAFVEYITQRGLLVENLSIKDVRKYINAFYGRESRNTVDITYQGSVYRIPIKILNKYRVDSGDGQENLEISTSLTEYKKFIRTGLIEYLEKKVPGKSDSTYKMYASDSNYLINNGFEEDFITFMNSSDDSLEIKQLIEKVLIEHRGTENVKDGGEYYYKVLCWQREYIQSIGGFDAIMNKL